MSAAVLGLLVGVAVGAGMAGGKVCFNAGVRKAAFDHEPAVLRIFGIAVAVQLVLLPLLVALGTGPLQRNVEAGAPVLLPIAQAVGGLVFGIGMSLAGGCITGVLWKAGAGSLATAIAIAGFAAGELLAHGPGGDVIATLDDAWRPPNGALQDVTGLPYEALALTLGTAVLVLLLSRSRTGLWRGVTLGVVAAAAWVAADAADYGYGLGFVGSAQATRDAIASGHRLPFPLFIAVGVMVGGALAVRGPLRLPDAARAGRALCGGVLMGVGGNLGHGCNIGHGLTGLALLSTGSLVATASMAIGAATAWRLLLQPRPWLRGFERPEPTGW